MVNNKKGMSSVATPIVLVVCIVFIMVIGMFLINMYIPFIWYQKLDNITRKYMFVIEKYGYLTIDENQNLVDELISKGFNIEKTHINAPMEKKGYGEIIEFEIKYDCPINVPVIEGNKLMMESKNIRLEIVKNGFSKR